jgi:hypothetical protein
MEHIASANALTARGCIGTWRRSLASIHAVEVSRLITSGMYWTILNLLVAMTAEAKFKIVTVMLVDEEKQELGSGDRECFEHIRKPTSRESLARRYLPRLIAVMDVRKTGSSTHIARKEGLLLIRVSLRLRDKLIGVLNCYTRPHVHDEDRRRPPSELRGNRHENSKLVVNCRRSGDAPPSQEQPADDSELCASDAATSAPLDRTGAAGGINRIRSIAAVHEVSREEMIG